MCSGQKEIIISRLDKLIKLSGTCYTPNEYQILSKAVKDLGKATKLWEQDHNKELLGQFDLFLIHYIEQHQGKVLDTGEGESH